MEGLVSAYSGTSLSLAVTAIGGGGTFADWGFALAGAPGSVGVGSINGNTGAFTLSHGLANATNDSQIDIATQRGYLAGLTLSVAGATATFGVTAGVAVDGASTDFMKLTSALPRPPQPGQ
jgi:hypothetical protein